MSGVIQMFFSLLSLSVPHCVLSHCENSNGYRGHGTACLACISSFVILVHDIYIY